MGGGGEENKARRERVIPKMMMIEETKLNLRAFSNGNFVRKNGMGGKRLTSSSS